MRSVLGKFIQRKFGKKSYARYRDKLKKKESLEIFCEIYNVLRHESPDELGEALQDLLKSVQISVTISRRFFYVTVSFLVTILALSIMELSEYMLLGTAGVATIFYIYKVVEYICNRYCYSDVRIMLLYKIALFHLLEESSLQKEKHEI